MVHLILSKGKIRLARCVRSSQHHRVFSECMWLPLTRFSDSDYWLSKAISGRWHCLPVPSCNEFTTDTHVQISMLWISVVRYSCFSRMFLTCIYEKHGSFGMGLKKDCLSLLKMEDLCLKEGDCTALYCFEHPVYQSEAHFDVWRDVVLCSKLYYLSIFYLIQTRCQPFKEIYFF